MSEPNQPLDALTTREAEILMLLGEGLSDREIADRLTIAYTTVKWYNRQIFNKLGVENRRQAIGRAKTLHLLDRDAAPNTPKRSFPASTTPFVGRERERSDLAQLLRDRQARLITLLAPGGMGKSRLVLAAAEAALPDFANGVFFVPLAPLTASEQMISTIAEHTGFQFSSDSRTPKQQLLDFFREKAILLVLDNFEHLLDGAPLITDILQSAPNAVVLVTSRERLNLSSETVYLLGGMVYPEKIGTEDEQNYSALQLFEQCARRMQPNFSLAADLDGTAHICRLVQGMPLAIELAAAWVNTLSLSEIAEEIRRNLDFLQTTMGDVPERLRSIRAVFDSSWKRLDERERAVFRRLSVFRGGCTREAAQSVASADLKTLTGLINKALLWRIPDSGRYEVHELLRQYAEQELGAAGEVDAITTAHSTYYLRVLHERQPDLEGHKQLEALKEIERDTENVRAAWLWAAQHNNLEAVGLSQQSLWLYYLIRGKYIDGIDVFEQAADELRSASSSRDRDTVLGSLLARQAFFYIDLGQKGQAEKRLDESQTLSRHSDVSEQAFLALAQGWTVWSWKAPADTRETLALALALYRQVDNPWGKALALQGLGTACLGGSNFREQLDVPQASVFLQEAFAIGQEIGSTYVLARTLKGLGIVAATLRNYEDAESLTLEGLQYNRQLGNLSRIAGDLNNLSVWASSQGNMEKSSLYLEESLSLYKEAGNVWGMILVLCNLSSDARLAGDFTRARAYGNEARMLGERTDHKPMIIRGLDRVSNAAWAQGDYAEAEVGMQRVASLCESDENLEDYCLYLLFLADILLAQGKAEEAHQYLEKVMSIAPNLEHAMALEMGHMQMGKLAFESRNYVQAQNFLEASLAYFSGEAVRDLIDGPGQNEQIARLLTLLGDVEGAESNLEAALRHYHEALEIVWEMRHTPPIILMVLAGRVELLRVMSQSERAVELAAFVRQHPATYAVDKDRVARMLNMLQAEMTAELFADAVERGKALELETVVTELLEADG